MASPVPKLLATMANKNSAVKDMDLLLQNQDVSRLRLTVYREADDVKNSQFLALASVYLVSVLMVSKYRDLLDPGTLHKLAQASTETNDTTVCSGDDVQTVNMGKNSTKSTHESPKALPVESNDNENEVEK